MGLELPELSQQPLYNVDGTPDLGYPLRILRAHRVNCDCRFVSSTNGNEETNPLLIEMNRLQEKRAELLDKAIAILEKELVV